MAQREPADHLLTLDEYSRLEDDPQYRDELFRGRLIREPPPGHQHGRVQVHLASRLARFVAEHELGYVATEGGFILEREPATVRGPDIAFVARSRYGTEMPQGWPEGAPDLAVEIVSPSDRLSALTQKVIQYFDAGARLVWIIDPADRTALVYGSVGEVAVISEQQELEGADVLPGFTCRLDEIFD